MKTQNTKQSFTLILVFSFFDIKLFRKARFIGEPGITD